MSMKSLGFAVFAAGILSLAFDDRFKALDRRVRLGFDDLAESLVGVFQPLFVFGLPNLAKTFLDTSGLVFTTWIASTQSRRQ
jgi:hypothetical protein